MGEVVNFPKRKKRKPALKLFLYVVAPCEGESDPELMREVDAAERIIKYALEGYFPGAGYGFVVGDADAIDAEVERLRGS